MRNFIISVIGPASSGEICTDSLEEEFARIFAPPTPIKKLAPHAFEFSMALNNLSDGLEKVRLVHKALSHLNVDVNCIPENGRRKKMLIADMDSTMIQQECIDEIADVAGIGPKVADITERAMRGEIDFHDAINERVALLKGLPESELQSVFDDRIEITPGARALIQTMKKNGAYCALVSGGFTFFTERVAREIGFDVQQANNLEIEEGKLSGRVVPPILGQQAKLTALEYYSKQRNLQPSDAVAVGDGANDLAMIKAAGLGVAFHAKPIVADQAHAKITHGDLTSLLYLQGYSEQDIVYECESP